METKFTKGEWRACCLENIPHYVFSEDKTICSIRYNDPNEQDFESLESIVTIEEARANAKLIQAVPEMFEILLDLNEDMEAFSDLGSIVS